MKVRFVLHLPVKVLMIIIPYSLTQECSTPVMALRAMNTGTSGSRAASMVRSYSSFRSHRLLTFRRVSIDVINVSGHRLSTAEIESALIMHKGVAETAGKALKLPLYFPFIHLPRVFVY
jgi:hypothetical protein